LIKESVISSYIDAGILLGWLGVFTSVFDAGVGMSLTGSQHCTRQATEGSAVLPLVQ